MIEYLLSRCKTYPYKLYSLCQSVKPNMKPQNSFSSTSLNLHENLMYWLKKIHGSSTRSYFYLSIYYNGVSSCPMQAFHISILAAHWHPFTKSEIIKVLNFIFSCYLVWPKSADSSYFGILCRWTCCKLKNASTKAHPVKVL